MTEPDEALIWAREDAAKLWDKYPERAAKVRAGVFDIYPSNLARAYRAGQAASAERIKALEEALLNLVDRVTEDDGEGCQTGVNAAEMISARALLKEADQ